MGVAQRLIGLLDEFFDKTFPITFLFLMKSLKISFLCLFLGWTSIQAQSLNEADVEAIYIVTAQQTASWNMGDIPGFMKGYWRSDSLVFVGSKGPTYGWQATLDNYLKSYPTPEKMGKLRFDIIRLVALENNHAFMIGKWMLDRKEKDLEGHFSLIWRKINGQWVIVADHSS